MRSFDLSTCACKKQHCSKCYPTAMQLACYWCITCNQCSHIAVSATLPSVLTLCQPWMLLHLSRLLLGRHQITAVLQQVLPNNYTTCVLLMHSHSQFSHNTVGATLPASPSCVALRSLGLLCLWAARQHVTTDLSATQHLHDYCAMCN